MSDDEIKPCEFDYIRRLNDDLNGLMMTFHLAPSIEVFNYVIMTDPELYRERDDPDQTEEFYVEYADEDWKDRKRRINGLKKQLAKRKAKPLHKSNYMHPYKLVWAYAAFRQFPWLIDGCTRPLYIERASKYVDNTLYNLSQRVGTKNGYQHVQNWWSLCRAFVKFNELRFGASGDRWYIDNMKEVTLSGCDTNHRFQMVLSDLVDVEPYYDEKTFEPHENTIDNALKLIHMVIGENRPVDLDAREV